MTPLILIFFKSSCRQHSRFKKWSPWKNSRRAYSPEDGSKTSAAVVTSHSPQMFITASVLKSSPSIHSPALDCERTTAAERQPETGHLLSAFILK